MSSTFGSSGTPMFGNFSSSSTMMPSNKTNAKSPKSSKKKNLTLENPLLKNAPFSFGSTNTAGFGATSAMATTPRSPLIAMTPNRDNLPQQQQQQRKAKQMATPGPPPKMSLSLMGGLAMSMQMKPALAAERQTKQPQQQQQQRLHTPMAVSTPVTVASPPYVAKKAESSNSYFAESALACSSESLVADHWVVAHGYTSSNEYKELLGILSSFGTIQSQEAGGNWLAVQYESRLAAEKAMCCQPILLSNTLCGITRGTPSLLQSLSSSSSSSSPSNKGGTAEQKQSSEPKTAKPSSLPTGKVGEQDILLLENSAYESREPYRPRSVCDKICAWYFGWDEHPHSD